MTRARTRWRWILLVYLLLLGASEAVRRRQASDGVPRPNERVLSVGAVAPDRRSARPVRLALFDSGPAGVPAPPVVVLLHGSPGDNHEVLPLARRLAGEFRVLAPDLPGFGGSSHHVPDYSFRAHARYVLQALDSLGVRRAHVLGFSMGGGGALSLADIAPDRVASLTLLSAIGVQEYELLGDYHLNHLVHGLQLGGLWLLRNALPHFGALDDGMLTHEYARNFYDSDQRPLRGILARYAGPMLIVQGKSDPLVPAAIAAEHARLVPQSELLMLDGNHFMAFRNPDLLAPPILRFLDTVEAGRAVLRATATPARVRAAARPFDPHDAPPASGIGLVVLLLLLASLTLVSEDLACIGTGLLISRGTLGFLPGVAACCVGIVAGDLLLYAAGRWLGRRLLQRVAPAGLARHLDRASGWLVRRGPVVVFTSRFVPGSRLPTFLAAGMLRTRLPAFAGYFLLAAAVWTPLLVGGALLYGEAAYMLLATWSHWTLPLVALTGLLLLALLKGLLPLSSWRGRRLLLSRWLRLTRWEYWPRWAFYPPIAFYVLWLGLKHRSLLGFTAANPGFPGGGFVGESKWAILRQLEGPDGVLPATALVPAGESLDARLDQVAEFRARHRFGWPVVLKPDIGERGDGVILARSDQEVRGYFEQARGDVLVQEYVAGPEFGLFYYRRPEEDRGRLFSITVKRLLSVTGDGTSTLESLILGSPRALGQARLFLSRHAADLWTVPPAGAVIPLAELGTHCRGAAFHDGGALESEALLARIDRISRGVPGFWFGRYDVRADSVAALREGRFRVIELNGVSSEATSIYDPEHTLAEAYATLRRQWRLAFEIGACNRRAGARPTGLREFAGLLRRHAAARRGHPRT